MSIKRPARDQVAVAVATATLLTLAVTWPVLGRPGQLALGAPGIDLPAKLWTLWWWIQPDRQALVNHPVGGVDLYLLTPVSGLLSAGLGGRVVLAHNVATALAVVVAVLGGSLWGRRLGGARGAMIGGLALGTAPAMLAAVHDGTGEFTWLGMVALSMWACDRLAARREAVFERSALARVVVAALVLAATAASCWYHGLAAGVGVTLHALARGERRVALPRVLLAGGLGLVLVLPLANQFAGSTLEPARQQAEDLLTHVVDGTAGPEPDHDVLKMAVIRRTQLVGPGDAPQPLWPLGLGGLLVVWLVGGARRGAAEGSRVAAVRARRALPLLLPGGVALVLSLGSSLPGGMPLPMLPLNRLLAWFGTPLHLPFHFGALTTVAVVGLAAVAASARPRLALGAGAVLVLSLYGPGHPLPMPVLQLESPAPLEALAQQDGAVLSLPAMLSDAQRDLDDEALRQVIHQRPIGGVPIFPTSMLMRDGVQMARGTELLRAAAGRTRADGTPPSTEDLQALGYRWVVVDLARAPQLARRLDQWLGPAWAEGDGLRVYQLR